MIISATTTAPEALPLYALTGFLGSGKTTLLAGLLRHPGMANTAIIVNELGEIGLDHFLIESQEEDMVLLNAGCLCCAILNTFSETLADLYFRRVRGDIPAFERVVVETTGLADPAPIVHTLVTSKVLAGRYRLEGVIAVVDSVLGWDELNRHPEVAKQVAVADHIVLTKTDIADAGAVAALHRRLAKLNLAAPVLEIQNGRVRDPSELINKRAPAFPDSSDEVRAWLGEEALTDHRLTRDRPLSLADADHDPHAPRPASVRPRARQEHHRHDDRIRSFSVYLDDPISWAGYAAWVDLLKQFRGPNVLRMKGLLNIQESPKKPVVVHAVQHVFYPPARLDRWPTEDHRSRIVIITWDLKETLVKRTLEALKAPPGSHYRQRLEDVVGEVSLDR